MKRLFVLGNGPSLLEHDLDSLMGEETWACNRIHLIYPLTAWRPTRWWWTDHPQVAWQLQDIFDAVDREKLCWPRRDIGDMLLGDYRPFGAMAPSGNPWPFRKPLDAHVHAWEFCNNHLASRVTDHNWPKKFHWPEDGSICKIGTGVSAMMAQAMTEGYDRIYLLGCDAKFTPGGKNHFDDNYLANHEPLTEEYSKVVNDRLMGAHVLLRDAAQERGVSILNINSSDVLRDVYEYTTLAEALSQ